MSFRLVESLSKKQREETPVAFAFWLVNQVRKRHNVYLVAALWVRRDSVYKQIPGVECYDARRNAYTYEGPHPVICHPPCGPHGKYRSHCNQDKQAGYHALLLANRWGGVVEQPNTSKLFLYGEYVEQGDYGHLARKPTRLCWFGPQ